MRSSNGYPASPNFYMLGVRDFEPTKGYKFPAGVLAGDVATILEYVADYLHANVERMHKGWLWGANFRPNKNNPNQLSDHSSATAIDYNAPAHPNGARGTFSSLQVRKIRMMLAHLEGTVKWGGDYHNTKDEMHWGISDETSRAAVHRVAVKLRTKRRIPKVVKAVKSRLVAKKAHPRAHDGLVVASLVAPGKHNQDVLEVQRVLNRWYPHLDIIEDGKYGTKTAGALQRAARSFKVRGYVSKPTVRIKVLRKLGFRVL